MSQPTAPSLKAVPSSSVQGQSPSTAPIPSPPVAGSAVVTRPTRQATIAHSFGPGFTGQGAMILPGGARFKSGSVHRGLVECPGPAEAAEGSDKVEVIFIEEGALICGPIIGTNIIVNGRVEGPVVALGDLTMGSKGVITEGASYGRWFLEFCSQIDGPVKRMMTDKEAKAAIAKVRDQYESVSIKPPSNVVPSPSEDGEKTVSLRPRSHTPG